MTQPWRHPMCGTLQAVDSWVSSSLAPEDWPPPRTRASASPAHPAAHEHAGEGAGEGGSQQVFADEQLVTPTAPEPAGERRRGRAQQQQQQHEEEEEEEQVDVVEVTLRPAALVSSTPAPPGGSGGDAGVGSAAGARRQSWQQQQQDEEGGQEAQGVELQPGSEGRHGQQGWWGGEPGARLQAAPAGEDSTAVGARQRGAGGPAATRGPGDARRRLLRHAAGQAGDAGGRAPQGMGEVEEGAAEPLGLAEEAGDVWGGGGGARSFPRVVRVFNRKAAPLPARPQPRAQPGGARRHHLPWTIHLDDASSLLKARNLVRAGVVVQAAVVGRGCGADARMHSSAACTATVPHRWRSWAWCSRPYATACRTRRCGTRSSPPSAFGRGLVLRAGNWCLQRAGFSGHNNAVLCPCGARRCVRNCPLHLRPDLHERLLNQALHAHGVI